MNVNPFSYLIEKLKGKVDKSGDTLSGNLIVQTGGECYVKAKNTVKETEAYLDVTATGEHGLWSSGYNDGTYHASGRWLIYRSGSNDVYVNSSKMPYNKDLSNPLIIDLTSYSSSASPLTDFNSVTASGIYWCYVNNPLNSPNTNNNGMLFVIATTDGIIQMYLDRTTGHLYTRGYRNTWSAWIDNSV